MPREALVFAFDGDRLYTFEAADAYSGSVFGGPLELDVVGRSFGPKPLHRIARLGAQHIPVLERDYLFELPLVYGMHYDGCRLSYRVQSSHKVDLLEIDPPSSSDDWPYPNFPPLLPYIPLRLDNTRRRVSYDDFASRFPNMPETQRAEMVVAVPPPATIGLSLWACGDGNGVTIVFECDLKMQRVTAYNLTS
jgi:hypothetical protein